jgi:hypothetical protein
MGLGWGATGLGCVYYFIRLLCGTIYFSTLWSELDWYWAGKYKDWIPYFSSMY